MTVLPAWTAIVLAGERPGGDPLARSLGEATKALIRIDGHPMIDHVVDALLASGNIERIVILAQDIGGLEEGGGPSLQDDRVSFGRSGAGIAASLSAWAGTDRAPLPVLVTTADNVLLTPARIETFLAGAVGTDIALGVGERSIVEAAYPDTRRTWLKFKDGQYSGANLFAFNGPACRAVLEHWSAIEQNRKKGLRLVASFGPWLLIQVALRRLTLAQALDQAGRALGCTARHVVLDAQAPIDVDKAEDLALVQTILRARR